MCSHGRRRRDATRQLNRIGVGGVYSAYMIPWKTAAQRLDYWLGFSGLIFDLEALPCRCWIQLNYPVRVRYNRAKSIVLKPSAQLS